VNVIDSKNLQEGLDAGATSPYRGQLGSAVAGLGIAACSRGRDTPRPPTRNPALNVSLQRHA
jgi:hypothetical protein